MYTDDTYQTISEARTAAMEVIKQAGVTQEEVDAAAARLAAAKAARHVQDDATMARACACL